ncbi:MULTISPECIES: Zn-ribbon domain-containing OB-fold protein [unclassified Sphingomonas]|uniref:Zn-ribbon domain-containing OB-fold protein n=1 Tax=unclassified Sphingomonas TaxID=196159 RepID=UPI001F27E195|nr:MULTISPECIES: OB-fold domain-containing protein [unclassified Sphingomonas]
MDKQGMDATGLAPVVDGLFAMGEDGLALLGSRCSACGTYYFPKLESFCRNPDCASESFEQVRLSRTGKLWSFTNSCYQPPAPYVSADPFVPYAIAAVELDREKMIVLGQVVDGVGVEDLRAGMEMELVPGTLLDAGDPGTKSTWNWRPVAGDVK